MEQLDRGGYSRAESPAADRHDDGVEVFDLPAQLLADGRGAENRERAVERMNERPSLLSFDLVDAVEGLVNIVYQLDGRAVLSRLRDAQRIRIARHHDLGSGTDDPGSVGHRHRMIARADRRHAPGERGRGKVQHVAERPAGLERAGALKQLLFEKHRSLGAHQRFDCRILPTTHGRLEDAVAEPLAGRPNRPDGRGVAHGFGISPSRASQGTISAPFSVQTA